jgi:Tfp pilus assembly protein PilF
MRINSAIIGTLAGLGLFAVAGCQGTFTSESAIVAVPFSQQGTPQEVVVESSLKRDSKLGVRYLGADAWDSAVNKLEFAVGSGDDDARTHHALGVAYEMTGNNTMAKAHYMLALENAGVHNVEYERAVQRIRAKLGEGTYASAQ